jgi:biopolymer transport protein ExbD
MKQVNTEDSVYMNVIPMVDIMFLLLLFFMLTADFGGRELEEVNLAHGKSIKEDKQEEAKDRLNVNIFLYPPASEGGDVNNDANWHIAIRGKRMGSKQLEQWGKDKARDHKLYKENMSAKDADDPMKPTALRVMIRADRKVPFKFVQVVQEKLALAGIYKLEYGAAEPEKK